MSGISVHKVVIRRASKDGSQWRAISYGANGEPIATTETYVRYEDAENAAATISEGATIERDDDAWPEPALARPFPEPWPGAKEEADAAATGQAETNG